MADACTESMSRFFAPHPTPATIPGEQRRWAPSHSAEHVKYRLIIEGRCPECGGFLERQELCGWCSTCTAGWTYQGSPTERDSAPPRGLAREPANSDVSGRDDASVQGSA